MAPPRFLLPAATVCALAALALASPAAASELCLRLAPVLGFAAGMSAVVNLASAAGVFEWVVGQVQRLTPSRWGLALRFYALCVVSTVFFSLDTTAIMLTPLAVAVARRAGWGIEALALPVVWIANLASLPLPVSNLTNLLASGTAHFDSPGSFARAAALPAGALIAVALAASCAAFGRYAGTPAAPPAFAADRAAAPQPRAALAVLAATLVALLLPVPFWLTACVAAAAMALAIGPARSGIRWTQLLPWRALCLTTTLCAATTLAGQLGVTAWAAHLKGAPLWWFAVAGAAAANAVNNIPAYLALEPAVGNARDVLALLVGVNAGPLITPWASLATLLWADQLRRGGERVPWGKFVGSGVVLAPVAVALGTAAIGAVSG